MPNTDYIDFLHFTLYTETPPPPPPPPPTHPPNTPTHPTHPPTHPTHTHTTFFIKQTLDYRVHIIVANLYIWDCATMIMNSAHLQACHNSPRVIAFVKCIPVDIAAVNRSPNGKAVNWPLSRPISRSCPFFDQNQGRRSGSPKSLPSRSTTHC